jgi:hypothetical protein
VTSPDVERWDAYGAHAGVAVDAQANAALAYDHLREALARSGLVGRAPPVVATVHYGHDFNGAFWDGTQAVFGDGDGMTFAPLASGLYVVAHELAHGVIQSGSGLGVAGEPGALNEALADALASFVQRSAGEPALAWRIGATVYTPGVAGDALRDLTRPAHRGEPPGPIDAAHDNGEVHRASSVPGHAFFRMAERLGADRAERVLVHALTHGLTPSADFLQMAHATLASAQRLFGPAEAAQVHAAWEEVGVLLPRGEVAVRDAGASDVEPNDTRRHADPLALGTSVSGVVSDAADVDWFRFQLEAPGVIQLRLVGDLELQLFDAGGRLVARSDPAGASGETIRGEVAAGAYFVKVLAAPDARVAQARYRLELGSVR